MERAELLLSDPGLEVEIGGPLWVGGLRWWTELDPGRFLVSVTAAGADGLAVLEADGTLTRLAVDFT